MAKSPSSDAHSSAVIARCEEESTEAVSRVNAISRRDRFASVPAEAGQGTPVAPTVVSWNKRRAPRGEYSLIAPVGLMACWPVSVCVGKSITTVLLSRSLRSGKSHKITRKRRETCPHPAPRTIFR